jgi:hypothetical protein
MRALAVIIFCFLAGCASSSTSWRMPVNDEGSRARPEAYGADGYTFSKDQPHRADPKPFEFYYKHCAINGDETYYSATSYDCSGPSF